MGNKITTSEHISASCLRTMAVAIGLSLTALPVSAASISVEVSTAGGKRTDAGELKTLASNAAINMPGGNSVTWTWDLFSRTTGNRKKPEIDKNPPANPPGKFEEPKVVNQAGAPLAGRNFDGIDKKAKTEFSSVEVTGIGKSTLQANKLDFTVEAKLSIAGQVNPPQQAGNRITAEYRGKASFTDPLYILAEDVLAAGLDLANFDLYIPFALSDFSVSATTDASFSLWLDTYEGRRTIFDMVAGPLAPASVGYDGAVSFYRLGAPGDVPDFLTDTPEDMGVFAAALAGEIDGTGGIGSGFRFGALVTGLDLSKGLLSNGAAASYSFGSGTGAYEFKEGRGPSTVPVPAALVLYASGLGLLSWRLRSVSAV